jgi:hypothetical protein
MPVNDTNVMPGSPVGNNGNMVIPGGYGNPTGAAKGGNKFAGAGVDFLGDNFLKINNPVHPQAPTQTNKPGYWSSQGIGNPLPESWTSTDKNGRPISTTFTGTDTRPRSFVGMPSSPGYAVGSNGMPNYNATIPGSPYSSGGQGQFGGGPSGPLPYLGNLNAGIGAQQYGYGGALSSELNDTYGHGFGNVLNNYLQTGAGYNSGVTSAMMEQFKVPEMRGRNAILDSFGDSGLRFSSTAATGLGWFEADLAGQQDKIMADQYNAAQDRYLSLIENLMSPMQENQSNQANWWDAAGAAISIGGAFI